MRVNAEHPTCPRCDTVLEEANPTLTGEATCENCGARFAWHTEANLTFHCVDTPETVRPAVTVACTSADLTVGWTTESEERARVLKEAWENQDPELLHSAILGVVAYLNALGHEEREQLKHPLPGQEIKMADIDSLPKGAVFADNTGDLWVREATGWYCYERLSGLTPEEDFQPFIYQTRI